MASLTHSWFAIGVVAAISLFATVTALTVQHFAGTTFATVLLGPTVAVCLVLAIARYRIQR